MVGHDCKDPQACKTKTNPLATQSQIRKDQPPTRLPPQTESELVKFPMQVDRSTGSRKPSFWLQHQLLEIELELPKSNQMFLLRWPRPKTYFLSGSGGLPSQFGQPVKAQVREVEEEEEQGANHAGGLCLREEDRDERAQRDHLSDPTYGYCGWLRNPLLAQLRNPGMI